MAKGTIRVCRGSSQGTLQVCKSQSGHLLGSADLPCSKQADRSGPGTREQGELENAIAGADQGCQVHPWTFHH